MLLDVANVDKQKQQIQLVPKYHTNKIRHVTSKFETFIPKFLDSFY